MRFIVEKNLEIEDFEEMEEIEQGYFASDTIPSSSQAYKWYLKNPEIEIVIRDFINNKIVAQATILPLSKEQYEKFIAGELKDTEFTEENLLKFEDNKEYYLMFCCVAITKEYRENRMVLYWLLKALYDRIKYLESRGIKFINMCAEGQTKDGQKFLESFLDLKLMGKTKDDYQLYYYEKDYDDFNRWFTTFPKYIENYYNKFK